ncbi:MAG TPA: sugar ABC transporter permease [Streptosporangiaceae bacterium]|jgi:sorbitol/mannitol transport system permease protein
MTAIAERAVPAGTGRGSARREGWRRRGPLMPALIFTIVVTQVPFLLTLYYSFQSWNLLRPGSFHFVGLGNYAAVIRDAEFRDALLVTVIMTLGSAVIALVLGTLLALLLERKVLGRGVVRTLLISPFLIMPAAAGLLWKTTMFDPVYGLVNFVLQPFGVHGVDFVARFPLASVMTVMVWRWTPFMMLIMLAGLQSQPTDVLEAARVDGARPFAAFREVTLPHLRPYMELGLLLGAIYIVGTFDEIYIMTQGGPGTSTTNLPFYLYQRTFQGYDIGQAASLGVATVIITFIVMTIALRTVFRLFTETEGR